MMRRAPFLAVFAAILAAPLAPAAQTPGDGGRPKLADVRVSFEKKGDMVEVSQVFTLEAPDGGIVPAGTGMRLALPRGAFGARPGGEEAMGFKIRADAVEVTAPVGPDGLEVDVVYDLAIVDNAISFEQDLPASGAQVQILSVYTAGNAQLAGKGFDKARTLETRTGLMALVIEANGLASPHVSVTLSGLEDGRMTGLHRATSAASVLFLILGVAVHLKRRGKGPRK
ncbi:MAG: hypothetical protein PHU25_13170 [Deltaproteobacteria bacterium]|nr:hypothetical protein [Deltaproteobacteria bacterium]